MSTDLATIPAAAVAAPANAMGGALAARESAEVYAAMMRAAATPRNETQAIDRITVACQRPGLAAKAVYSYPRAGTDVTGPSIRLAETLALAWGNIQTGVREVERRDGESAMVAYAIDLERNVRVEMAFTVKHLRDKKGGAVKLTDERDIYEIGANMGARRKRACILALIPGDVIEGAVEQANETMRATADCSPAGLAKVAKAFAEFGVTQAMLEKRVGRRLDSFTPANVVGLRTIYASIADGMSKAADWFEFAPEKSVTPARPPVAPPPADDFAPDGSHDGDELIGGAK